MVAGRIHDTDSRHLTRRTASTLGCASLAVAVFFLALAILGMFDASLSVFIPPWEEETGLGWVIVIWAVTNFLAWCATAVAALRRRKLFVFAALICDVVIFVPMVIA